MEDNIDNLTLQFLLNNKSYQKIMTRKEDSVYNKQSKMNEHKSTILKIVENIINNDAEDITMTMTMTQCLTICKVHYGGVKRLTKLLNIFDFPQSTRTTVVHIIIIRFYNCFIIIMITPTSQLYFFSCII